MFGPPPYPIQEPAASDFDVEMLALPHLIAMSLIQTPPKGYLPRLEIYSDLVRRYDLDDDLGS